MIKFKPYDLNLIILERSKVGVTEDQFGDYYNNSEDRYEVESLKYPPIVDIHWKTENSNENELIIATCNMMGLGNAMLSKRRHKTGLYNSTYIKLKEQADKTSV